MLRPGGTVILIETLGTGFATPHPPDHLAAYFSFLNKEEFRRARIGPTTGSGIGPRACSWRFFFGDDTAAKIVEGERGVILPECTGCSGGGSSLEMPRNASVEPMGQMLWEKSASVRSRT